LSASLFPGKITSGSRPFHRYLGGFMGGAAMARNLSMMGKQISGEEFSADGIFAHG